MDIEHKACMLAPALLLFRGWRLEAGWPLGEKIKMKIYGKRRTNCIEYKVKGLKFAYFSAQLNQFSRRLQLIFKHCKCFSK